MIHRDTWRYEDGAHFDYSGCGSIAAHDRRARGVISYTSTDNLYADIHQCHHAGVMAANRQCITISLLPITPFERPG